MLHDYLVLYRSFKGMGYWGRFKYTKAYDNVHALAKMERIAKGFFAVQGGITGEFRIERCTNG